MRFPGWIARRWSSRNVLKASLGLLSVTALTTFALYIFLYKNAKTINIQDIIGHLGFTTFAITSAIYALAMVFSVIVWGWMMGTIGHNWQWWEHAKIYFITTFTRRLPGAIWYMIGRVVMYERLGVPRTQTIIVGGIEAGVLIASGLVVALLAWPTSLVGQALSPGWFIAGAIGCVIVLNPQVLGAIIRKVSRQPDIQVSYPQLLGWMLIHSLTWACNGSILFALANSIHPLQPSQLPAIIGIGAATGVMSFLLSIVPFGLGIQEITITVLLTPIIGEADALIVALLARAVLTFNELLWAIIGGMWNIQELYESIRKARFSLSEGKKPKEVEAVEGVPPAK